MVPTDLNELPADDDDGVPREGSVTAPIELDGLTDGDDGVVLRCGAAMPPTPPVDLEPLVVDVLDENCASAWFTHENRTNAAKLMVL